MPDDESLHIQQNGSQTTVVILGERRVAGIIPVLVGLGLCFSPLQLTEQSHAGLAVIGGLMLIYIGVAILLPDGLIFIFDNDARTAHRTRSFCNGMWHRHDVFSYDEIEGIAITGPFAAEDSRSIFYPILKPRHGKIIGLGASTQSYLALEAPTLELSIATGLPWLGLL